VAALGRVETYEPPRPRVNRTIRQKCVACVAVPCVHEKRARTNQSVFEMPSIISRTTFGDVWRWARRMAVLFPGRNDCTFVVFANNHAGTCELHRRLRGFLEILSGGSMAEC